MKMKVGVRIILSNLITILIFFIICIVLFITMGRLAENQKWVSHTYEVIADAEQLLAYMVDQETGMRGFLATGNDNYLEPYNNGKKEFETLIDELMDTVNDNPVQVDRLGTIRKKAADWDDRAASRFIAIRRGIAESDVLENRINSRMTDAIGKIKMDSFRRALDRYSSRQISGSIILSMINMETGLRGFLVTGDENFLEPYNEGESNIPSQLKALNVPSITTLANDWIENYAEVQIDEKRESMKFQKRTDLNEALAENIGKTYMDGIRADIAEFTGMEEELLVLRNAEAERQRRTANLITILGALAASAVAVVISLFITRSITLQLGGEPEEIAEISSKVSSGDLKIDFPERKLTGVYSSMKEMTLNLQNIVREIISAAEQVAGGSEQISNSAQEISSGTSEQASNMEEVSASLEQLNSNIQQNSDNANQSNAMAKQVAGDSKEGSVAVAETVEAMKDIAEKISVIQEIARSTNMLALNAAIEAARAGDAGRGFAVVAAEVRKLAESSGQAAKEITEITQNSVHRAVTAQEKIEQVVPIMQKTAELVEEITMASQEQTKGADQINAAVVQLDSVIQQNASSSEELASMSEELRAQAVAMKNAIGFFSIKQAATGGMKYLENRNKAVAKIENKTEDKIENKTEDKIEDEAKPHFKDGEDPLVIKDTAPQDQFEEF